MTRLWSPQIVNDPEKFVLFAFPWGEPGTPLERYKGPRTWQRQVLRDIRDHIADNGDVDMYKVLRMATASGRGIGKSALVSWLVLWMLTTRIGASVIVSANSEAQLRSITWAEITKWLAMLMNSHWWEISATRITPAKWLAEIVERDLRKGTRYWGAEGRLWSEENPDAYAGLHNSDGVMLIFDEASGIPDKIWDVAQGFFTENTPHRFWCAFSNPRRNQGYFYECFNAKRAFWNIRQIDARTVEDTDKAVYQQIIDEYGEDSPQARIEVYGEFPSTGDEQFIPPRIVDEAFKRPKYKDPQAPIVIGVDPARSGSDSTVIVARQGRDLLEIRRYKGDDTMTVVGHVIEAIEDFKPALVVLDEGGLGYGILDRLTEQRYKVRGVNFGWKAKNPIMWGNKRAEIWGAMREWLKTAAVQEDRQLKNDLTGPKTKPDSTGTIYLESKKDMKSRGLASPDAADALAVTFAFPVASRGEYNSRIERRVVSERGMVATSWMGS
jgi:ribosomal protein L34